MILNKTSTLQNNQELIHTIFEIQRALYFFPWLLPRLDQDIKKTIRRERD